MFINYCYQPVLTLDSLTASDRRLLKRWMPNFTFINYCYDQHILNFETLTTNGRRIIKKTMPNFMFINYCYDQHVLTFDSLTASGRRIIKKKNVYKTLRYRSTGCSSFTLPNLSIMDVPITYKLLL
jgi:hypothetical protein